MYLNTLGVKHDMIKGWIKKTPAIINQNVMKLPTVKRRLNQAQVDRKEFLVSYFHNLDKVDSHYCRKRTKKKYIAATFRTKRKVFNHYQGECSENKSVSYFTFATVFDQMNLSLFMPRKDQCDLCVCFKASQVSQGEYELHKVNEKRAKEEKDFDKTAAIEKRRHTFSMEAVKLAPDINASAIYFRTRLQTHNFTIYNLASHQCTNYWWNETEGDMSASSFISCIIHHLKTHCLSDSLPIVLYSDGCGYQNRNQYLSNALSCFAIEHNKIVGQKFLEKGHTQMECDSAHANIEKKLNKESIFVPSDYVTVSSEGRKTVMIDNTRVKLPFDNEYLNYGFFSNYADSKLLRFNSIRPGVKKLDATVTQLRSIIYLPSGSVKYKTDFDSQYRDLPRIIQPYSSQHSSTEKLHSSRLKITKSKYKHLQELKSVIPTEYHDFYNNLPYNENTMKGETENIGTETTGKNVRIKPVNTDIRIRATASKNLSVRKGSKNLSVKEGNKNLGVKKGSKNNSVKEVIQKFSVKKESKNLCVKKNQKDICVKTRSNTLGVKESQTFGVKKGNNQIGVKKDTTTKCAKTSIKKECFIAKRTKNRFKKEEKI